ncbi:MAG TPA: hypothetical protein VFI60_06495 [Candidatus Acidoferrum sp.]|nr:hypothetical protein [Candidatus Acidoferrum sp.]
MQVLHKKDLERQNATLSQRSIDLRQKVAAQAKKRPFLSGQAPLAMHYGEAGQSYELHEKKKARDSRPVLSEGQTAAK